MPLIGFSAQLIPYVMAMFFTMIFFNGNNLAKAEKPASKYLAISGNHITFNENPNAIPNLYHYENHSNTLSTVYDFTTAFRSKRVCSLIPIYRNIFSHSCSARTSPHRGPPCLLA